MPSPANISPGATLTVKTRDEGVVVVTFAGRLDSRGTADLRSDAQSSLQSDPKRLVVDASDVTYADGAGIALFIELWRHQRASGREFEIRGLDAEFRALLDMYPAGQFDEHPKERKRLSAFLEIGKATVHVLEDLRLLLAFVGELIARTINAFVRPSTLRWGDTFRIMETAGVNALPIISLVGFLIGLIIAFQSAMGLKRFGAEIFAADLLAIPLIRELGPLLTAIILAARSGSAFAAEIGTMKVNEEIDALTTMGLSPVAFLAVPRVIAALVMTPLLAVFTNVFGILGGAVVITSLGYPLVTYWNHVTGIVSVTDLAGAFVKTVVFGVLVAAVGCLRGLQTKLGALAVGESTTRSVVAGIVLIIVTDGLFAVVYYFLGI